MNAQVKRALLPILRDVRARKTPTFKQSNTAEWILHKLRKPSPLRAKPSAQRKEAKAAQHREETGRIREAVFARADGFCEAGICRDRATELDHWLSGSGRRRQKQSVETCWALCARDHRYRTEQIPNAAFWNDLFRLHCASHGYPFTAHIEHADLPWKAAP